VNLKKEAQSFLAMRLFVEVPGLLKLFRTYSKIALRGKELP
jgi:hypothetical protein